MAGERVLAGRWSVEVRGKIELRCCVLVFAGRWNASRSLAQPGTEEAIDLDDQREGQSWRPLSMP